MNAFFGGVFEIYCFDDATVYVVKVCTSAFFFKSIVISKLLWSNTLTCAFVIKEVAVVRIMDKLIMGTSKIRLRKRIKYPLEK